ncbi:MAG: hypothetical protein R6X18_20670 [Chloroflexota bacterium]
MTTPRILVVTDEEKWTRQAMHLACAMARNLDASVALIQLVPVANPYQLGNIDHPPDFDPDHQAFINELLVTSEDYQTKTEIIRLHYASYINGISSAAEELQALGLFSPPSRYKGHLWERLQSWRLRRAVKCPLFTLDPADQPGWVQSPKPALTRN